MGQRPGAGAQEPEIEDEEPEPEPDEDEEPVPESEGDEPVDELRTARYQQIIRTVTACLARRMTPGVKYALEELVRDLLYERGLGDPYGEDPIVPKRPGLSEAQRIMDNRLAARQLAADIKAML